MSNPPSHLRCIACEDAMGMCETCRAEYERMKAERTGRAPTDEDRAVQNAVRTT